jgi:hypothetical protein
MRTPGDVSEREDTSTTTYAGGIVIACILLLVAIRKGFVKGGN